MALKNAVQWLVCLMLGGIVGYQLRSPSTGAAAANATSEAGVKKEGSLGFGPSLSGEGPASKKKESGDAGSKEKLSLGERIKALLDEGGDSKSTKKSVEALSEPEIQAALSLLASMPKSSERDTLRATLYAAWSKTNPNAAWKAALAADTGGYPSFSASVAGEIAKTRPSLAMDLALSLGMGSKRSGAMQYIFSEWGKVDAAGAIDYFNKHPDLPTASWTISNAIYQMAEKDPKRAGALALTLSDQQARTNGIRSLMRQWAGDDPKAALAWAQGLGNASLQQEAITDALGGWALKDPKVAMDAVQTLKEPGARTNAMQRIFANWFEKDPTAAVDFLSKSGDDKLLNQISWRMSNGEFTSDEITSLMAKLPDGKGKEEVLRNVVDGEIRKGQYTRAIEQLNTLPDSPNRDYALQNLGRQWAASDPKAAEAWIKLQPDSSDRDLAVAGFAGALARTNISSALQWAETIPDQSVKTETLKTIALRWLNSDPAKANAWLEKSSGWSANEIKSVRENAQNWSPNSSYSVTVSKRH